jgi:hypothetical protein
VEAGSIPTAVTQSLSTRIQAKTYPLSEGATGRSTSINTVVKVAGDVCGPAVAEQGKEFLEVADIPGWRDYDFPELRRAAPK